jgi:hypothetical protein
MTVKETIALLQKMPDHSLMMMIDCPYCGKGNQLDSIDECVVLGSVANGDSSPRSAAQDRVTSKKKGTL